MPMVLPCASLPISALRLTLALAAQRAVGLDNALRQREQHAERVLGDGIGVAAGLVDHQHAGRGAGVDIDGIEARAVAGDDQQIRRPLQKIGMGMEMRRQFVARRTDLIGVRRGQDRREQISGLSFSSRSSRTSARAFSISV